MSSRMQRAWSATQSGSSGKKDSTPAVSWTVIAVTTESGWHPMLASASKSACKPAPLVGSVAAKVSTAGRGGDAGSGIRCEGDEAGRKGGLHLKPDLGSRADREWIRSFRASRREQHILTNAPTFAYAVLHCACRVALQDLALPCLRVRLRRSRRLARGRDCCGHAVGGHSRRMVLPGLRGAQRRARNGRDLNRPRACIERASKCPD